MVMPGISSNHRSPRDYISLRHVLKEFEGFNNLPILCISCNHSIPRDHISFCHFVEHLECFFYIITFDIHVYKSTAHKDVRLKSTSNYLLMELLSKFQSCQVGTCWKNTCKGKMIRSDAS
eukprot:Gb_15339 [translate_table: standard]